MWLMEHMEEVDTEMKAIQVNRKKCSKDSDSGRWDETSEWLEFHILIYDKQNVTFIRRAGGKRLYPAGIKKLT